MNGEVSTMVAPITVPDDPQWTREQVHDLAESVIGVRDIEAFLNPKDPPHKKTSRSKEQGYGKEL